ncbi:hypothetical protein HJG60_012073 [Phyllostomus discolor]|uniref:Uncharacterized protein n=1 Tax=Phyllostomus discolor TaxID=89673 RepID=A0A833ZQ49_9CHIR|nr:hypothetical protein HJG60_012073 [Phyllostomus discolor]
MRGRQAMTRLGQLVPLQSCSSAHWTLSWAYPSTTCNACRSCMLHRRPGNWRTSAVCMAGSKPSSWRATGPLPPGHSFHLLDSSASVKSKDTLCYRMVRVAWYVPVTKVRKPGAQEPHLRLWNFRPRC